MATLIGSHPDPMACPPATITPAEARVLSELRRGHSNRGIASQLVLSIRTVESHISNLLAKTGCQSRTQLLLWSLALAPQAISSAGE